MADTPNQMTALRRQEEREAAREFQGEERRTGILGFESKEREGKKCSSSQTINVRPHKGRIPK